MIFRGSFTEVSDSLIFRKCLRVIIAVRPTVMAFHRRIPRHHAFPDFRSTEKSYIKGNKTKARLSQKTLAEFPMMEWLGQQ